jgi:hypothetical protein
MQIQVKRKNVYGNELIYVCNPTHADIIRKLTGKKTVSEQDLSLLQMLGVEIQDIDKEIKKIMEA